MASTIVHTHNKAIVFIVLRRNRKKNSIVQLHNACHISRRMEKEAIKAWLKAIGRNRAWLCEQCGYTLNGINCWLSGKRPIPSKAQIIIAALMRQCPAAESASPASESAPADNAVTISITESQFDKWNAAATAENKLLRQWCVDVIEAHFTPPPGGVQ